MLREMNTQMPLWLVLSQGPRGPAPPLLSAYARAKSAQFVARRKDSLHRRYAQFCSTGNREEDKTRNPYTHTARTTYNKERHQWPCHNVYNVHQLNSHWVHPNVRIRVSIKLHLQCHLSIASSHCTALPIPSQHHSPRTTVPPPYSQHCPQCVDNILLVFLGHSGGSLQAPMWLHVQGNLSKRLNTQTSWF